ncbi:ABC-three component system protein, partial [Shewanella sp. c952]|uniref:ABC-three component system protein n=1 Tax=Shewanella sp. c952 TaxID=2815913 RepID=UPI001C7DBEB4
MKKNLVILVHGLTGGEETWTNSSSELLSDLLKGNRELSDSYDFVEFDYFTKLANLKNSMLAKGVVALMNYVPGVNMKLPKRQKNVSVLTLAEELATFVQYECSDYENIVFMAHSMGGLITKKFILDFIGNGYEDIQSKILGYLSIASPHKGSLPATLLGPININAKELAPLNKNMNELNDIWIEQFDSLPNSHYMIAKNDEFVSEVSAVPSSSRVKFKRSLLNDDHNSICKPDGSSERSYKVIESFLLQTLEQIKLSVILGEKYDPDIHSYDSEVFVIKMILARIENNLIDDAKESFFHADLALKSAPKKDRKIFDTLEAQIISVYRTYSSCADGKSSSEVVKEIHQKIFELDKTSLDCAAKYINFLHKKGILHHNANNIDLKVNWSK